ncbi:MAG: hypothetical protein JWN04_3701 [Myxococcaceae bacterium]|nr:hypothetical protein [Myxococcaceae bacterium]
MRSTLAAVVLQLALAGSVAHAQTMAAASPPDRPSEDSVQEAGRTLFRAIVEDAPKLAAEVFFPRDAFVQVKAMQKPERYFDKLEARFVRDIHALHQAVHGLSEASFVRLELG